MSRRTRIRNTQWREVSPAALRESMRDVQSALDSIPDQQIIVTEPQQYTEPMYLATGDERVPRIVSLARIVNADAPETPVAYGAVTWAFAGGTGGQVKIIDIASMSTGATRYMFTWKVEW